MLAYICGIIRNDTSSVCNLLPPAQLLPHGAMLALRERGPVPESLSVAANGTSPEKSLATSVFRSLALGGISQKGGGDDDR